MAAVPERHEIHYLENMEPEPHVLHRSIDGMTHESCNIDDARKAGNIIEWPEWHDFMDGLTKCKRCFK